MPKPRRDEERKDFLDRGMVDREAVRDFPDEAQRFAFLLRQWEDTEWRKGWGQAHQAMTGKFVPGKVRKAEDELSWSCEITKIDDEQRLVYGWFSVIEENGKPVVDRQGDRISEPVMVEMFHKFMQDSRAGKAMHKGKRTGDVVELLLFTRDVQKALGIDLKRVGAFGAYKVRDDDVWARVKSGELKAFSFGGHGERKQA